MRSPSTARRILPIIIFSQFCCTSLWFAGNGVMEALVTTFQLPAASTGHLTAAVQFGFILGTLFYALLSIADRFSPSRVFFVSAVLAAGFNGLTVWDNHSLFSLLLLRFGTGFFLAGIYPVGMKIAADYYDRGLGKSLGYLVGALVLGTAFPHLLRGAGESLPWKSVLLVTSGLAILGGLLLQLLVPDGPFRKAAQKIDLTNVVTVFRDRKFRGAAFGYFGHMWELYTFWAFIPLVLLEYFGQRGLEVNISLWSFAIIAVGGPACVIGGYWSLRAGPARVAGLALSASMLCCLLSPLFLWLAPPMLLLLFLLFWGMVVVADSPLFSTLVARHAPTEIRGTALTVVNCIGFGITIFSIQLLNYLSVSSPYHYLLPLLALGPVLGLAALRKLLRSA
ncbi:MFS transporter [Lewinella sp. W8]|uniref:MFS transporter n=1 Tax=Lewinella sp. W8 TaxID=2528208 RepID=UPI001067E910|nr:MFS transporter [Lewinella sp. W8]MTB53299.1 MFS transporter [Lewinella sp. W8]